jgi:hypothetical protein
MLESLGEILYLAYKVSSFHGSDKVGDLHKRSYALQMSISIAGSFHHMISLVFLARTHHP